MSEKPALSGDAPPHQQDPKTGQGRPAQLSAVQRFSGTLSDGDKAIPVRFKARIGNDGEVELDLHAFRITKATWFVRERFQDRSDVAEFALSGIAADGLRFESDSLSFNSLGERWSGIHNRHWSKPRGECGKIRYFRTLDTARDRPVLKLHLKGFECFRSRWPISMRLLR